MMVVPLPVSKQLVTGIGDFVTVRIFHRKKLCWNERNTLAGLAWPIERIVAAVMIYT
jgi:hypothetical protein